MFLNKSAAKRGLTMVPLLLLFGAMTGLLARRRSAVAAGITVSGVWGVAVGLGAGSVSSVGSASVLALANFIVGLPCGYLMRRAVALVRPTTS
jgi:hypothetical protein